MSTNQDASVGIPWARPNEDGSVTCPECGEHIPEEYDGLGERLTNNYGHHYAEKHEEQ